MTATAHDMPQVSSHRSPAMNRGRPPRLLLYSHDSYGLGHLQRSLNVARAVAHSAADMSALIVSGTPVPAAFELPPRCDLVKLPSITKNEAGAYTARSLPVPFDGLRRIRGDIILATARAFRPDVFLVDHTACGPGNELLPVLERLRSQGLCTSVVLGLRDVIDDVPRVLVQMRREHTIETIRRFYDRVLVYGDPRVYDARVAYRLPADIRAKTELTGIVCRPFAAPVVRNGGRPHIVAAAGGGEDGYRLLRGVVAALRGPLREAALDATLVTGPLLDPEARAALDAALQDDPRLRLLRYCPNMERLHAGADLVVSMGGYNSVYEALRAGRRLLVLPRAFPRREQLVRSEHLERLGLLRILTDDIARDPATLGTVLLETLRREPPVPFLDFRGAEQAAASLIACAASTGLAAEASP